MAVGYYQWATTSSTAWSSWTTTTAMTTGDTSAWVVWCDDSTATTAGAATWMWAEWQAPVAQKKQNRAQRRLAQRQEAERQAEAARRAKEAEAKRLAAQAKAEATLLAHLSPEQEKAWRENRHIFVTGKSGKRYLVTEHGAQEWDVAGNRMLRTFCNHVIGAVPGPDAVLTRKLALEYNEPYFHRCANPSDGVRFQQ
jgi:hypothetical protein